MKYLLRLLVFTLLSSLVIFSCSSSTDSDDEEEEYVAELSDFANYTSWTKVATAVGPDPLLAAAHGANDTLTRNIFFKNDANSSNGKYSKGTLIIKELRDQEGNLTGALTMMAKRGGDFNPDGNGWEWFMTSTDLTTVLTQGNNQTAGEGMCATCHAGANTNNNGIDWVFSKKP